MKDAIMRAWGESSDLERVTMATVMTTVLTLFGLYVVIMLIILAFKYPVLVLFALMFPFGKLFYNIIKNAFFH